MESAGEAMEAASEEMLHEYRWTDGMINLSSRLIGTLGVRSYYNQEYGINVSKDGYVVGRYDKTSTDYEIEQMISFKDYLDSKGIQLLYVSEPAKYIDDFYYYQQFGGESYLNRNADLFLSRLGEAGITYLDLREIIREENIDSMSLFYRTDHHWTVPASKWAAETIAEKLNEDYGYQIDLAVYADENYDILIYPECWLGEQGRKIGQNYIGLDDYVTIKPLYETSFVVGGDEQEKESDFVGTFLDMDLINSSQVEPPTAISSLHYAFHEIIGQDIYNNNVTEGSILLLGDSYAISMLPYLSLGIHHLYHIQPRSLEKSVRDYIEEGNYDTVIIAYAQFMIGTHDDEENANYDQFTLE